MYYTTAIFIALAMASCTVKSNVFTDYNYNYGEDKECPNNSCVWLSTMHYDTYQPVLNNEFINIVDECIP